MPTSESAPEIIFDRRLQTGAASGQTTDASSLVTANASSKPSSSILRIDLIGSLRRHPVVAATIATIVLVLGLPIAYKRGTYQYSASAVIFVSPRFLANLQDDKEFELQSNSQYREYVQQQVQTINRFDIVQDALSELGPRKNVFVGKGESLRNATERLQGALVIKPIPDTYQIAVSLQGASKDMLAPVVNSVVAVFLRRAKSEELYASTQRIANLTVDSNKLRQEIAEKQAQRTAIGQELGVTTFTDNLINPYDKLLVDAKTALAESRRVLIQADSSLLSIDRAQRAEGARALRALAQDLAGKDSALTSLQANLNQRRAVLLTSISGMRSDHPVRKAAEQELASLEGEQSRLYEKLTGEYSSTLLEQRKAEAFKTREVERLLKQEVAQQESLASWFTTKYQEGMALGLDISRARKRLDSIQDRIDFLSLEGRAPGFARLFTEARTPLAPAKGDRKILLEMVLVAALALAMIIPIGIDFFDPRLHLPADMERVLGFDLIGWLLCSEGAGPAFHHEQICRLASRISQDHQVHGSRLFAFTAVKAGAGTTSIVTKTALALTRMGAPTLAVEANAYRADPRYRRQGARGLAVVLRGTHGLEDVVVPGNDEFPDSIPVGEIDHTRHLPDVLNLIESLRSSEGAYHIVLLDIPPLMTSTDSEILARNADVTVLVAEAGTVTRRDLQKAARILERLRPRSVAAILNKVTMAAGRGMGRRALYEFEHGFSPARPTWSSPWLWR